MEDKTIYTTKEAADYLGISPSTIYRMEKRGLLSPTKTSGGQRRFSQKNLEECLKRSQILETPVIREKSALIKIYEKAIANNDERMIRFCEAVFDDYDEFGINRHITRPNGK